MTRMEIAEKLKEVISLAMPDSKEIIENYSEDSSLNVDLGLNSVGILFVVIAIEEMFSVSFDNKNFDDFKTVRDVIDYIERKQAA